MNTLILFFTLALTVSFVCSLTESVILSVSHVYIAVLEKSGRRSGRILRRLKLRINYSLAAILTFNTVANTVGAAAIGAQTYRVFGSEWIALSSVIFTVMILVFSEVFPKTIGAAHWKRIAPAAGYVISAFIYLSYPIVLLLEAISRFLSRNARQKSVTREEIIVLAEIGVSEGVLSGMEARIIENLLLLNEIRTEDILTPRSVIMVLQKDLTVAEAMEMAPSIGVPDEWAPRRVEVHTSGTPNSTSRGAGRFTRIPVYDRDLDDLIGLVLHDRLMEAFCTGRRDMKIESLMGPIYAVPASKPIADLLDEFINRREHLFEVVDEYGGTAGIVTLEDVLETLLGVEIVDELDSVEDMRAYAVERWKQKRRERGDSERVDFP